MKRVWLAIGDSNEGVGSNTYDQTANGNHGTLIGPTWTRGYVPPRVPYVYNWDVFNSGFFGESDNVVFRIEAYPSLRSGVNGVPVFQRPYASSTTFPFRVRGTQVRVLTGTQSISNALVYRLPSGQLQDAMPFAAASGQLFHTDNNGYLQGRGRIDNGDRLIALYPISATTSYTVYATSAPANTTGLTATTVSQAGVQTLTVSANNPLILFNLSVSLEWDARNDPDYLNGLQSDLQRASAFLYNFTNGQAALGQLRIYQDKEQWNYAHLRVYATNRLRPNANQGGLVTKVITDPQASTTITYASGQIRIGAVWNRFGESSGTIGEDWPRTLAHELGHYLFFLDDNYLGVGSNGLLVTLPITPGAPRCAGAMTDPYRDDNSEFHPNANWINECANTLSQVHTQRSDWATMRMISSTLFIG